MKCTGGGVRIASTSRASRERGVTEAGREVRVLLRGEEVGRPQDVVRGLREESTLLYSLPYNPPYSPAQNKRILK
jgi:hypothetical protein